MDPMKKLAVLMPTYNAAPFIQESIDSILGQTYTDFDLYIYDDCSTDTTQDIVGQYKDPRVYYVKNKENLGIAKSLNKGLEALLPNYDFIARMDADDWAYPTRFEQQLAYLQQHEDVVLCGTQGYWLKDITLNPEQGWQYPVSPHYIKFYLLFAASFGHSSVIIQSRFFIKHHLRYNESIKTCEDWDLWIRAVTLGKVANVSAFLMKYRVLDSSNHRNLDKKQLHLKERSNIISNHWAYFGITLTPEQIFDFYYGERPLTKTAFLKQSQILIQAYNHIYQLAYGGLTKSERAGFSYMLARRVLDYWKRSQVSRTDLSIWWHLVKAVTFRNPFKLIKSMIR